MVGLSAHDLLRGFWFRAAISGANLFEGNGEGILDFGLSDSSERKVKAGPMRARLYGRPQ